MSRKPISTAIIILLIQVLLLGMAFADEEETDSEKEKKKKQTEFEKITLFIVKKRVNAAYLMFGGNNLNAGEVNEYLTVNQHPKVEEMNAALGFGGHVVHNKLVVGLELMRTLPRNKVSDKAFNTSISSKYVLLNFGYRLYWKKGLMKYPYIGLGYGHLVLNTRENNIGSFDDITGYQKGSRSTRANLLFNVGFGVDYFYRYNQKKRGMNNITMGIRVGWLFSPVRWDWKVNNIQVEDGPNQGINGPYIRFTIGLGGWIEKFIKIAI